MQEIIQAIQEHASPRLYDWLILVVALLAIVISGLAAYFAYRLNQKQSAILEQQNRIALFDKRHEVYLYILPLYSYGLNCNDDKIEKNGSNDIYFVIFDILCENYRRFLPQHDELFLDSFESKEYNLSYLKDDIRHFIDGLEKIHITITSKLPLLFEPKICEGYIKLYLKMLHILTLSLKFTDDEKMEKEILEFNLQAYYFSRVTFQKAIDVMELHK